MGVGTKQFYMKKINALFVVTMAVGLGIQAESVTNYVVGTNFVMVTPKLIFCLANRTSSKYAAEQFKSDDLICYKLIGVDTNYVFYRKFNYNQTYELKLTDANGKIVPKTKMGLAMDEPPVLPRSRMEVPESNGTIVREDMADFRALFRADEIFAITNKGSYQMEIRMRIYVPATNGVLDISSMTNGYKFLASKHFGVLSSPPLCVKVVKE